MGLPQSPALANSQTRRDDLDLFDRADDFKIHCATVIACRWTWRVFAGHTKRSSAQVSVRKKDANLGHQAPVCAPREELAGLDMSCVTSMRDPGHLSLCRRGRCFWGAICNLRKAEPFFDLLLSRIGGATCEVLFLGRWRAVRHWSGNRLPDVRGSLTFGCCC